jgi:hypothetical protein
MCYGLEKIMDLIKNKEDLREIGEEIIELGKEGVKARVNVESMYTGLWYVKDLIKDKEDLKEVGKEIVELGKEAVEAGKNVSDVYRGELRKRIIKKLKKKG